jgi:hypothetical protein
MELFEAALQRIEFALLGLGVFSLLASVVK